MLLMLAAPVLTDATYADAAATIRSELRPLPDRAGVAGSDDVGVLQAH